jgi:hypothetical protein
MKELKFEDEMLECTSQLKVREMVSGLPDDSLSMAWRSALNEKLIAAGKVSRQRKRMNLILRPAFGLAVASALALVLVMQPSRIAPPSSTKNPGLAAALVKDHRENVELTDMVGSGLNPLESRPTDSLIDDPIGWSDVDIDSL